MKASHTRGVVPRGTGGSMVPPNFGTSVNPISTNCNGGRLCPPNNTGTPGFPDLPRALRLHTTSPNSFSENRSRGCSLGIVLGRSITHKSSSTCHNWMKEVSSRIFIHSRVTSCQQNLIKTFQIKAMVH